MRSFPLLWKTQQTQLLSDSLAQHHTISSCHAPPLQTSPAFLNDSRKLALPFKDCFSKLASQAANLFELWVFFLDCCIKFRVSLFSAWRLWTEGSPHHHPHHHPGTFLPWVGGGLSRSHRGACGGKSEATLYQPLKNFCQNVKHYLPLDIKWRPFFFFFLTQ